MNFMQHSTMIFLCVLAQFIVPLVFDKTEHIKPLYISLIGLLLLASVFNLISGLQMAFDWNPFIDIDAELIQKGASSHGGKGGIAVMIIRFWPYVLIGMSGFYIYHCIRLAIKR